MNSVSRWPAGDNYRLADVVRSEWTKFISLRSSRWTLMAFPVVGVALGILIAALSDAHYPTMSVTSRAQWDPTNNILAGLIPGYLVIPVLGVLMMTSEYTYGSISPTLAAVPRRPLVLAAKAVVFATVAFAVCESVTFGAYLAGEHVMSSAPHETLADPRVLRALILSAAYLVLMGLFGLGLGTIVRRSGAAVALYTGLVIVAPMLLRAVPGNLWRFGPIIILANSVSAVKMLPGVLSPWTGFAVMAAYTAVTLVAAAVLLVRRDA